MSKVQHQIDNFSKKVPKNRFIKKLMKEKKVHFRLTSCNSGKLQRSNDHVGMNLLHENLNLQIPRIPNNLVKAFIVLFTPTKSIQKYRMKIL